MAWQEAPGLDPEELALAAEDQELGRQAEEELDQEVTVHLSLTLSTAPLPPEQSVGNPEDSQLKEESQQQSRVTVLEKALADSTQTKSS